LLLRRRAHEGQLLGAGHVVRIGTAVEGVGALLLVQRDEDATVDGLFGELFRLGGGSVDPVDLIRLAHLRDLVHPGEKMRIGSRPFLRDEHSHLEKRSPCVLGKPTELSF